MAMQTGSPSLHFASKSGSESLWLHLMHIFHDDLSYQDESSDEEYRVKGPAKRSARHSVDAEVSIYYY